MKMTEIEFEILEDGTVSMTTGEIADTLHLPADELLDAIQDGLGGKSERKRREHPFWKNRTVLRGGKIVKLSA